MTWDRDAILAMLDRRTVAGREIYRVINLAEDEMRAQRKEAAETLETFQVEAEAERKALEVEKGMVESENKLLTATNQQYESRFRLLTQRHVLDDKLTMEFTHPGHEDSPYGDRLASWWPLQQLEETLVNLRIQGAQDSSQVLMGQESLKVEISPEGYVPVPVKAEVTTAVAVSDDRPPTKWEILWIVGTALALVGLGFFLGAVIF